LRAAWWPPRSISVSFPASRDADGPEPVHALTDGAPDTTNARLWRVIFCPGGSGKTSISTPNQQVAGASNRTTSQWHAGCNPLSSTCLTPSRLIPRSRWATPHSASRMPCVTSGQSGSSRHGARRSASPGSASANRPHIAKCRTGAALWRMHYTRCTLSRDGVLALGRT
jgi:hypothetical protein